MQNRNFNVTAMAAIAMTLALVAVAVLRSPAQPNAVVALDQGWDDATATHMHYLTQGAVIMPAAWLRALRSARGTPVMDPATLKRFDFIGTGAPATAQNPYGWPIGMTVDRVDGIETAGFTCTACHTSELTYRGRVLRVEGGSGGFDGGAFFAWLHSAVVATESNPKARQRFLTQAVAYGYPKARAAHDFDAAARNANLWLLHNAAIGGSSVMPGPGRLDAFTAIVNRLFAYDLAQPDAAIRGTAPVRFPYMWDIWRFDWVQYDASVRQPMSRNVGEALGVGVKTHMVDAAGTLNPEPLRWTSSLRVKHLYEIEQALATLKPPVWPASVFGSVDPGQAARGKVLFAQYCSRCHGVFTINGTSPTEWAMRVTPLQAIGTDPNQALLVAGARIDAAKLGIARQLAPPEGVAYVVHHIQQQAYKDAGITGDQIPVYDGWGRTGHVTAPCGYKARPLVGTWATPPFLHNGSVRDRGASDRRSARRKSTTSSPT